VLREALEHVDLDLAGPTDSTADGQVVEPASWDASYRLMGPRQLERLNSGTGKLKAPSGRN